MLEVVVGLAVLGWLLAFVFAALWWGLYQRMDLLERLGTTGHPWSTNGAGASAVEGSGGDDFDRAQSDLREFEIDQLSSHLEQQARRQGRSVSQEALRKEAKQMLRELDGKSGGTW